MAHTFRTNGRELNEIKEKGKRHQKMTKNEGNKRCEPDVPQIAVIRLRVVAPNCNVKVKPDKDGGGESVHTSAAIKMMTRRSRTFMAVAKRIISDHAVSWGLNYIGQYSAIKRAWPSSLPYVTFTY